MYICGSVWEGWGGGSDGKTSSTHPHNPLLTPLRWLLPGLQFFQLENDLVHIFETREVFIFLCLHHSKLFAMPTSVSWRLPENDFG